MTPDKGFLSRSHVPGENPTNEPGDVYRGSHGGNCVVSPSDSTSRWGHAFDNSPHPARSALRRANFVSIPKIRGESMPEAEPAKKAVVHVGEDEKYWGKPAFIAIFEYLARKKIWRVPSS